MYYAALHNYMLALVAQKRSEVATCSKPNNPRRRFDVFDSARSKSDCCRPVSPACVWPPLCNCSFDLSLFNPSSLWTFLKGGPDPASSIRLSRSKCPHRSLHRVEILNKQAAFHSALACFLDRKPTSFSASKTKNQNPGPPQE